MINMSFQMKCTCHLFIFNALPRASYGHIRCGLIPSAVWRFSSSFRCRSVSFELATSCINVLGVALGFVLLGRYMYEDMFVCMSLCLLVHVDAHMCICMSVSTFLYVSLCLYVC